MSQLTDLRQRADGAPLPHGVPEDAAVFIHGIFSSHATFESLTSRLDEYLPDSYQLGMYYFDYDFRQSIPDSGRELAATLRLAFPDESARVTLVGHSMGGLVARAALLQEGDLGLVRRLVMLGTPNHGTLHTARLGLMTHLVKEATYVLWTLFPRQSTGIKELTQIGKTFTPLLREGTARTRSVEYVTIPGLRFNLESGWLESPQETSAGLRTMAVFFSILSAIPGMRADLRLPHDGIVEETSVRLSADPGGFSERPATGVGRPPFAPYLHVTHPDYETVDHVTVQKAERTIQLLAELLASPDLETWRRSLAERGEFNLYP